MRRARDAPDRAAPRRGGADRRCRDNGAAAAAARRARGRGPRGGARHEPAKLPLAEHLGATATATGIEALQGHAPDGFDFAIDATGTAPAIETTAFGALRRGGRLLVFGVANADARISLSPFRIYNDEIVVLGSMAVLHWFGPALELVRSGAIDVDAMLAPRSRSTRSGTRSRTCARAPASRARCCRTGEPPAAGGRTPEVFGHHVLRTEQVLPGTPDEVFPFFADAGDLEAITPAWLGFRIVTPRPIEMRVGTLIE